LQNFGRARSCVRPRHRNLGRYARGSVL
jgi:hypothetical protein